MINSKFSLLLIFVISFAACSSKENVGEKYIPDKKELASEKEAGFEVPTVFKAKSILPKSVLQNKIYKIEDDVYNDGLLNHYTISTEWGDFYAFSNDNLQTRLNEIITIDTLKKVSTGEAVLTGTGKAGKSIILAPVNLVVGLGNAIIHPVDTGKKIISIPVGVYDFFVGLGNKVDDEVDDAKEGYEGGGSKNVAMKIYDAGAGFAKDWIGYSRNLKELLEKYHVDPDSDNEILRGEIARVARIHTGVGFGANFIPGIPMISVLSDAHTVLGYVDKISIYEDKTIQENKVREELLALGIDEKQVRKFQKNSYIQTTQRSVITNYILSMKDVENRGELINITHEIETKEGAYLYIQMINNLFKLNHDYKFKKIISGVPIPTATTADNRIVVSLPIDYFFWTRYTSEIIKKIHKAVSSNYKDYQLLISLKGKISNRAKEEITKLGFKII